MKKTQIFSSHLFDFLTVHLMRKCSGIYQLWALFCFLLVCQFLENTYLWPIRNSFYNVKMYPSPQGLQSLLLKQNRRALARLPHLFFLLQSLKAKCVLTHFFVRIIGLFCKKWQWESPPVTNCLYSFLFSPFAQLRLIHPENCNKVLVIMSIAFRRISMCS